MLITYPQRNRIIRSTGRAVVAYSANHLDCGGFVIEDIQSEKEVKRLPDLGGIHHFAEILVSLPALRELHISNVLKSFLENPKHACACSIAGTKSCTCGQCSCHCPSPLRLPFYPMQSMSETEAALWGVLHAYFRRALPVAPDGLPAQYLLMSFDNSNDFSDYDGVLDPLAHGVHVFLHEKFAINLSLENKATSAVEQDCQKLLHKSKWHATFHLAPPEWAKTPAKPPNFPSESARQRQTRVEGENRERQATRNSCSNRNGRARGTSTRSRRVPTAVTQSAGNIRPPTGLDGRPLIRSLPEGQDLRDLTDFENELRITIIDKEKFDSIIEIEIMRSDTHKKGKGGGELRD